MKVTIDLKLVNFDFADNNNKTKQVEAGESVTLAFEKDVAGDGKLSKGADLIIRRVKAEIEYCKSNDNSQEYEFIDIKVEDKHTDVAVFTQIEGEPVEVGQNRLFVHKQILHKYNFPSWYGKEHNDTRETRLLEAAGKLPGETGKKINFKRKL